MSEMLDRMYKPDGKNLALMLWGQAGSGKTVFLEQTTKQFLIKDKDPDMRIFYISPKNEGFEFLDEIHFDLDKAFSAILKSRAVAYYPGMDDLESNVDDAIEGIFELQGSNPDAKFTLIIDDAQIFLSSRRSASDAHKRLALTGRSRKIKAIYVSHNIVFSRELEGQVDTLIGFNNPNPLYYRSAIERYGFDPEPHADDLRSREYSFVWVDLRSGTDQLMNPIDISQKLEPKLEIKEDRADSYSLN